MNQITRKGVLFLILGWLSVQSIQACSSSYVPTNSYQGTVSGSSGLNATLILTMNTQYNAENATGVLDLGDTGGTISLRGNFSTGGVLSVSGGGYTFSGNASEGALLGSFSGPDSTSGAFSTLDSTENTITLYCGTFTGSDSGIWNMEISSNHDAAASAVSASHTTLYTGDILGSNLSLTNTAGANASGVLSGTTLNGTWQTPDGDSGTFSASTEACP